jgi:hypothetical protein
MAQIQLEFDNTLSKSDIIMPIMSVSEHDGANVDNSASYTDKSQLAVFGIQVPLIMINNTVIDFDAVSYFSLKSNGPLPSLVMSVEDRYGLISNIDKPKHDNEVRIQVLPRFDNAYKKINLTFYITNINVAGKFIRLTCTYKLSKLTSSKYEAFGELSTYNIFKNAATDIGLGFATNIADGADNRYIYCNNKSWLELLNEEIQYSGVENQVLDWWIDFWDNINLADVYERYITTDSDEDITVWVTSQIDEMQKDSDIGCINIPAVLTDHPAYERSELFVTDYVIYNNPGAQVSMGSDKVYGVYEDDRDEYLDHLVQDGDVKEDIYTKYYYLGETYGEYNYLLQKELRNAFLQKMNSESIKVTLKSPLLGLMRGHKVNFIKYINDSAIENKMQILEEAGVIDRNVESNIPLADYEVTADFDNGIFKIDRTVSGQYLITGMDLIYEQNKWKYVLTMNRPANIAPDIMKTE